MNSAITATTTSSDARILRDGFRHAREITRTGSRSFYLASRLLDPMRRRAAYALYGLLRGADDAADEAGEASVRLARIATQQDRLERAYAGRGRNALEAAMTWAISRYSIPRGPLEALIETVRTDVGRVRIPTWLALDAYCHGVASTVGLAMAPVLGVPDSALPHAAMLGHAMQLTNILRDVREDLEHDRVYLPAEVLADAGLAEEDLRAGTLDDRWTSVAREIGSRAHTLYNAAEEGIEQIPTRRARATVRVMRAVYREILVEIERRNYDVFARRVVIGTRRKAWIAARVLMGADPARARGQR